ncbi:MAG: MFS transporter [Chloroflexota bacterium]
MVNNSKLPGKRSIAFLFGMSSLMFGANLVWVAYNSVLLPTLIENVMTAGKGLAVGLIGFFGTLIAVIVSIVAGILSDHTSTRWGRRTPAILTGALVSLPFIALPYLILTPALKAAFLSLALPIIIVSYCGMQLFTNVGNGAWWPLLVDMVPERQRGAAAGIQGFLTMLGSALGIVPITLLNENGHTMGALWLIGATFAFTGLLNVCFIRGLDKPVAPSDRISLWNATRDMFKVRTRVAVFFWVAFALLLAFMGVNGMQFFARYFFEVYFPDINPDAAFRTMGGISLVVTMLSAVASGVLSDRIGRRPLLLASMFVSAVATLLMGFVSDFDLFLALAAIRSAATGPLLSIAPALASDLAPKEEAGQYMAYNNLSTGLSGAFVSLIFGVILVTLTRTAFMVVFIVSAVFFLLGGIVFLVKAPQKELEARIKDAK